MNVADLQQHLRDLSRLLEASKAKEVGKDLATIADGLTPFQAMKLADFAAFLRQAQEYAATGIVPATHTRANRGGGGRKAAVKPDAAEVAQRIRQLYDSASNLSVPMENIEGELRPLTALTKPGLLQVAQALELRVPGKMKVDQLRQLIRQQVLDRRGASQRAGMTSLPGATE